MSDSVMLRAVAHQAPLSMEYSREEYCSGLPFPPPEALPDPGIEHMSLLSSVLAGGFFNISATWEAIFRILKPKGVSQVVQMVKNLPAMQETWI